MKTLAYPDPAGEREGTAEAERKGSSTSSSYYSNTLEEVVLVTSLTEIIRFSACQPPLAQVFIHSSAV